MKSLNESVVESVGIVQQSGKSVSAIRMRYADYCAAMIADEEFCKNIELGSLGRPYASYAGIPVVFDNKCWPGEIHIDAWELKQEGWT